MILQRPPSLVFNKLNCPRNLASSLGGRLPHKGSKIGLLGGSFNPAHKAHYQISLEAMKHLDLDEIWWLVSPQNPLKKTRGMARLSERVNSALSIQQHPRIRVTTIESQLGSVYTADTLGKLVRHFPKVDFTWLMGADNLSQISRWRDWQSIFMSVKIAVFARPGYSLKASSSKAARRFRQSRIPGHRSKTLHQQTLPAWTLIHGQQLKISSTAIRASTAIRDRQKKE